MRFQVQSREAERRPRRQRGRCPDGAIDRDIEVRKPRSTASLQG